MSLIGLGRLCYRGWFPAWVGGLVPQEAALGGLMVEVSLSQIESDLGKSSYPVVPAGLPRFSLGCCLPATVEWGGVGWDVHAFCHSAAAAEEGHMDSVYQLRPIRVGSGREQPNS